MFILAEVRTSEKQSHTSYIDQNQIKTKMPLCLDLSLPDRVPEIDQSEGMDGRPFAVYAISPVAAWDIEAVCRKCDEQVDEEIKQMRPAPVTPNDRFVNKPLRDVVEFHRNLVREDSSWDILYFAVVTKDDWMETGILLVTLSSNDEFKPDAFYLPAGEVGSNLVNLQIGNTDWIETRYGYEGYHQARISENGNDDDNADDHHDDNHEDDQDESSDDDSDDDHGDDNRTNENAGRDEQTRGRQYQSLAPCFLVYNASYPPQSAHSVFDILDPGWQKKHFTSDERFVEGQIPWERAYKTHTGLINTVWCTDPWSEAVAHHPAQCKQQTQVSWQGKSIDRNLDTRFFVYCDEAFARDETVSLVEMDWDSDILRDERAIWEVVYYNNITVKKESCKAEDAYSRLTAIRGGSSRLRGAATEYSRSPPRQPDGFSKWV